MGKLAAVATKDSDIERELREDLAAAYQLADHFGWDDSINSHFSVRLPGPDHHFLINDFGTVFGEVTASSLIRIDLAGNILTPGDHRMNLAGFTIHAGIHAARDDAQCVMHCHTVAGVAVSAQRDGLLPLSGHSMVIHGRVGYHGWEGVVIDQDEVPRIVRNLGDNPVLLLRNHGTIAVGSSIAQAFFNLYYLERACQVQIAALSGGRELVMPPEGAPAHTQRQMAGAFADLADLNWAAMKRILDRKGSNYRD